MASLKDPEEVGGSLRAIDAYNGNSIVAAALRMAPYVFVRPGELRHAEWVEINFELAEWRIPAEKMKQRIKKPSLKVKYDEWKRNKLFKYLIDKNINLNLNPHLK